MEIVSEEMTRSIEIGIENRIPIPLSMAQDWRDKVEGVELENKMLKEFWDRVCEIMWDAGDLDGGTFQDWGTDIGLLREEIYDPEGKHKDVFIMEATAGDPVYINVLSEKES